MFRDSRIERTAFLQFIYPPKTMRKGRSMLLQHFAKVGTVSVVATQYQRHLLRESGGLEQRVVRCILSAIPAA
jgi:hypothetical protein